jgi:hypothetical protein
VPKNYDQQPDVQLIPYYEFDPKIHNIEYRFFETPEYQNALSHYYANLYAQQNQGFPGDFRGPVEVDYRRPPYGYGYHPYGYGGFHPWGYGGFHPYGGYHGYHGYHKESSPSR